MLIYLIFRNKFMELQQSHQQLVESNARQELEQRFDRPNTQPKVGFYFKIGKVNLNFGGSKKWWYLDCLIKNSY